ncbi:MAG: hypothetical protein Tsb005_11100 [Gammaproteobacteria bacterium]
MNWFRKHWPRRQQGHDIVSLNLEGHQLAITYATQDSEQERPQLNVCEVHPYHDLAELTDILTSLVRKYHLKYKPCKWILAPSRYQLILLDILNVSDNELASAVRWQIKDRLTFPLDDALVEVFKVPPYGLSNQYKKMYAAIARHSELQAVADVLHECDLRLEHIDIGELALHTLLTLQNTGSTHSQALISIREANSEILISRNDALFLTRRLDLDVNKIDSEYVWLEIQRSFDYCTSQLGFELPEKLMFTGMLEPDAALLVYLRQQLADKLKILDVARLFSTELSLTNRLQQQCLYALGGLLRKESGEHATAS